VRERRKEGRVEGVEDNGHSVSGKLINSHQNIIRNLDEESEHASTVYSLFHVQKVEHAQNLNSMYWLPSIIDRNTVVTLLFYKMPSLVDKMISPLVRGMRAQLGKKLQQYGLRYDGAHTHTHKHTHEHTHTHAHTHTNTHLNTHIHTRTHVYRPPGPLLRQACV
jgi:ABC-type nickel/cobalt efflux system permease component RcnA